VPWERVDKKEGRNEKNGKETEEEEEETGPISAADSMTKIIFKATDHPRLGVILES